MRKLLLALCVFALSVPLAGAQDSVAVESAREEITSATRRFVSAFNNGDTPTLLSLCTRSGDFVDGSHPRVFFQDRIKANAAFDANRQDSTPSGATVVMSINNIRFVTPQVAMVDGTSVYRPSPDVVPNYSRYSAVWVYQNNNWLLDDIRENPVPDNSHNAHLRSLEWLTGSWMDNESDPRISVTYRWSSDGSYIEATCKSRLPGRGEHSGTQRIGWDARFGEFRSWTFDHRGAFSEGQWNAAEDSWTVELSGTTADGYATADQIQIKKVDANTMEWVFTNGTQNGQRLPDFRLQLSRRAAR
jgi:hypothetical protein